MTKLTAFGVVDWILWSVGDLLEVFRTVVIQQHDATLCRDRVPGSVPELTHLQEYKLGVD